MVSLTATPAPTSSTPPPASARSSARRSSTRTAPTDAYITEPAERALALALLDFGDVVVQVGDQLEPHRLCGYLFELAQAFSAFYEQCPVLKADTAVRASRLALCAAPWPCSTRGSTCSGSRAPQQM